MLVLVAGSEFLAALSTLPTQAKHAATGNKNDCLDTWSPVAKLSAAHSVGSDLSSLRTYFRRPCDLVLVLDLLNGATVVATTSLLALFHPARVIEAFPSRRLTSTGDIKSETVMTNDDKVNA